MILKESHEQLSLDDEICEYEPGYAHPIPAFTNFHFCVTHDGRYINMCDTHYYEVATLQ